MWERIVKNIDGHRVAKTIYGTIIILVVMVTLQEHPPSPLGTMATVVLTGLGVALAEFYSDFIGISIKEQHLLDRMERRDIIKDVSAVMTGALLPLPFVILAWVGVISLDLAIDLAKWTMVGVLLFYGYVASRLSGQSRPRSFLYAIMASVIGIFVVLFKDAFGH
jgi:hypothetical protein